MSNINFTTKALHVALSTYPLGKELDYINHIDELYNDFITERNDYSRVTDDEFYLYKPLKYHLFGHFDLAFISIIDSYKFAQRVFDNSKNDFDSKSNLSYQIQCGTILSFSDFTKIDNYLSLYASKNLDLLYSAYPYMQIANLKLNNGILIGNGNTFLTLVLEKLKVIFNSESDVINIISNSYNWSDLTFVILSKSSKAIFETMLKLRQLIVVQLFEDEESALNSSIINNSLYKGKFNYAKKEIIKSHVFVDTHSYMGVAFDLYKNNSPIFHTNEPFKTNIEWQIKPGHFSSFYKEINKESIFSNKIYYKNGKTDFITIESNPVTIQSNQKIFTSLRNSEAKQHIRKLKTKPIYELSEHHLEYEESECVLNMKEKLVVNKINDLPLLNDILKKINLSRQLRMKIQKAFHNYNNGITDSISYVFFIDFKPFLEFFKTRIITLGKQIDHILAGNNTNLSDIERLNVGAIESLFDKILQAFEEAYNDRFLNNYNFEDLNDFKIDFNTSVTQIITTYDPIIKELSSSLLAEAPGILVRQNELNTESNIISINYNVFHLIEPPLIFNTVVKELLNSLDFNFTKEAKFREILGSSRNLIKNELSKGNKNSVIFDDFDFQYFKIDVIKFLYTFNGNTELYVFWSWIYFLQNTSLYSSIGFVMESNFNRELFRILLVVATFDKNYLLNNRIESPVPELFSYWEKNYTRFKSTALEVIETEAFNELVITLLDIYRNNIVTNEVNEVIPSQVFKDFRGKKENNPPDYKILLDEYRMKAKADVIQRMFRKYNNNSSNMNIVRDRWETLELSYIFMHREFELGKSFSWGSTKMREHSEESGSMFFNRISYTTLMWYFKKMDGKINLLRRDYSTGQPMESFIMAKDRETIFIDPQGDFFITSNTLRKSTMKFKHAVYHSLWHLALVLKFDSFLPYKKDNDEK